MNIFDIIVNSRKRTPDSIASAVPVVLDAAVLPTRGVYVGGAGNIKVTGADGVDYTLTGIATGYWHPMVITKVKTSGTTATNILLGY